MTDSLHSPVTTIHTSIQLSLTFTGALYPAPSQCSHQPLSLSISLSPEPVILSLSPSPKQPLVCIPLWPLLDHLHLAAKPALSVFIPLQEDK